MSCIFDTKFVELRLNATVRVETEACHAFSIKNLSCVTTVTAKELWLPHSCAYDIANLITAMACSELESQRVRPSVEQIYVSTEAHRRLQRQARRIASVATSCLGPWHRPRHPNMPLPAGLLVSQSRFSEAAQESGRSQDIKLLMTNAQNKCKKDPHLRQRVVPHI